MMINANSPKPLYLQIKAYLLAQIHAGSYPPDARIPSERDLAKQFQVNRLTVNKALRELIQDGVLYTTVGKGTFVRGARIDQQLSNLTSFTEEMAKRGQQAASRILATHTQPAAAETAHILQITAGAEVIILKRVRLADEKPIALETSTLIAALCPGLLEGHDFSRESLYAVLRTQYHLTLAYAEQTMEARRATRDEARWLEIEPGDPILNITRVTRMADDRPFEYVRSAYRGDCYTFHAVLRQL